MGKKGVLMKELFYAWLVVALSFVLGEIAHPGLFLFLSFAGGACGAAVASLLGYSFVVQCSVALVTTLFGFMVLFGWLRLRGYTGQEQGAQASNIYALSGKQGTVLKAVVPNQFGAVKINGEIWSARAVHNKSIEQGCIVEVITVRGAHVIVKEL